MTLTELQKRHLRKLAHPLKPVVMIGQAGLKETVTAEIDLALDHHELIKVKVSTGDRASRDQMIDRAVATAVADLVQRVGNIAVLYRPNPKKREPIKLPTAS